MKVQLLLLLLLPLSLQAQTDKLKGKVTDSNRQPIEYAAVMMQSEDSIYICSTSTDSLGNFLLPQSRTKFRLIVQQLSYKTHIRLYHNTDTLNIVLKEEANMLKEVVVKANRPLVKVKDGKLNYDLSVLSEKKVVDNVYEAIKELPGISEEHGNLTLAGASGLNVILNGKPTTMTSDQLTTLLKSMPVDRVEKAEVMYSAPPQYHVRGAAINLVLKKTSTYSFQGEAKINYKNQFFSSYGAGANFRITTPKTGLDLNYSTQNGNDYFQYLTISKHTLNNKLHDILLEQKISNKGWKHNVRGSLEYNFNDKSNINLSYNGAFSPDNRNTSETKGSYQDSYTNIKEKSRLNNVSLQYKSGFGLNIGADYTNYHTTGDQGLISKVGEKTVSFQLSNGQDIDRLAVTADQTHQLKRNWSIGYGASYSYAHDRDHQQYENVEGISSTNNTQSDLKEQTTDFYVQASKNYDSGISFSLSGTGEYYTIGDYHKWAFYPQASLTYFTSPKHIFQFSLSSNKEYPSYWQMQPFETYTDAYMIIKGTPGLQPASVYNLSASYILQQNYVFTLFYNRTNKFFQQAAYQSTQQLLLIYQTRNWDYNIQYGVNITLPLKIGGWLSSQLNLTGVNMRQKCDDYFDIPFDRHSLVGVVNLNNTFSIGRNLFFELNGKTQTKAIQGTYDIGSIYNVDAGIKYNFSKGRATLSAKVYDIFKSGMPKVNVDFKGQNLFMNTNFYTRSVEIHFTYRFGGYKEKENKKIDTSRFGH